jgi:uroporphyrinogen decarboxylase
VTAIERVRAALAGKAADRPPFTIWYHFGVQHASAERTAQAHLEFFEAYQLDWLKLMNDYSYPMPDGVESVRDPRDLAGLRPLELERTPLGRQLDVVSTVSRALADRALVVDTVFNAWNTLRRNVVKEFMDVLMREHARALEVALTVVNQNLIRYARASLGRGAAGIFLSVPATPDSLTREQYERFMRPFDLALLEAIRDQGEFHILHAHGGQLYLDALLEYPVHAISWADRASGPTLGEMRRRTRRTLVGGIDHVKFAELSAAALREQVRTAIADAGSERLLLAPGCAVPTYSFPDLIRAARAAATGD